MFKNKIKIIFLIICSLQLFYLFNFRSGFNYEVFKNSFKEDYAVFNIVPAEVSESNSILKKHKTNNFNLTDTLRKNTLLYQRFIDFNYPIRMKKTSRFVFSHISENVSDTCKVIDTGKYIKLSKC